MEILNQNSISEIVNKINVGEVGVLPSESSYGLSCDAINNKSVEKIFNIKDRDGNKSVLIVVDSIAMAQKYLIWNDALDELAKKYWLNCCSWPLTVVGEYKNSEEDFGVLATGVVSKQNTLAVRVSWHPLLKEIVKKLGRPLVSTSANLAGESPIYNSSEIIKKFENRAISPNFLVDYGNLPLNQPSTIVSVVGGKSVVLRQGSLRLDG